MALESFFSGSALELVAIDGSTTLPPFIVQGLRGRYGTRRVLFGAHEQDRCISGYDEGYAAMLYAELERRRLRDEGGGIASASHHCRIRRMFGASGRAEFDESGRITLPAVMRRRSGIGDLALFVGTGASFEIWNPHVALEEGGESMRELVEIALLQPA